nr:hypothetical protein [Thalassotalea sp. G20_0]
MGYLSLTEVVLKFEPENFTKLSFTLQMKQTIRADFNGEELSFTLELWCL